MARETHHSKVDTIEPEQSASGDLFVRVENRIRSVHTISLTRVGSLKGAPPKTYSAARRPAQTRAAHAGCLVQRKERHGGCANR